MGHTKSSLLLKGVIFVRAFESLTSGQLGCSLPMFVADSNRVESCPAYLFFWDWFSSGLEDGISSRKHVVGHLRSGALPGEGRERNGKEKNGSPLLSVVADCWASLAGEAY